jgi:hypothetical protein
LNGKVFQYFCARFPTLAVAALTAAVFLITIGSSWATTHYVDVNGTNATPPYTNWATAATNIQDAVDVAVAGDEVVVTNGTYANNVTFADAVLVVDRPLSVRSVNGPLVTIVNGGGGNRCAWLTNGACLSGFSLTNGYVYGDGGGAYGGTLNKCWLIRNSAIFDGDFGSGNGGGAAYCTLNDCTIVSNLALGYFPYFADVGNYGDGGGAYYCTLINCTISGNSAQIEAQGEGQGGGSTYGDGGGAARCTLHNCTLTANKAIVRLTGHGIFFSDAGDGGGEYYCALNNCTLTGNSGGGGGAYGGTLNNCIRFGNVGLVVAGFTNYLACVDCDSPGTLAGNNWSGNPLFLDTNGWANLRLESNSPCINAGNNAFAPTGPDLDGNPRIIGGTVDIGAYEYQSLSLINFGVLSNQAAFSITGQSNQVVTVETSADLQNWSPLATNTLNGHPFPFTDPTPATLPQRFYRAQSQ